LDNTLRKKEIAMMKQVGMTALLVIALVQGVRADDALNLALFKAISDGNVQEVQSLISRGADVSVSVSEIKGKNPPYNATGELDLKDGPLMLGETPFSYALSRKNKAISRLLANNMVKFSVPVTWGGGSKSTIYPLRTAVSYDDVEITRVLLQRGASITEADPLFSAVKSTVMADFLLAQGANVNATDSKGDSALHGMASNFDFNVAVAEWLLAHSADVNAKDMKGWTPLHDAVLLYGGGLISVKFLLEHGAEVNAKDNNGATPLHLLGSKDFYHDSSKDNKQQLVAL